MTTFTPGPLGEAERALAQRLLELGADPQLVETLYRHHDPRQTEQEHFATGRRYRYFDHQGTLIAKLDQPIPMVGDIAIDRDWVYTNYPLTPTDCARYGLMPESSAARAYVANLLDDEPQWMPVPGAAVCVFPGTGAYPRNGRIIGPDMGASCVGRWLVQLDPKNPGEEETVSVCIDELQVLNEEGEGGSAAEDALGDLIWRRTLAAYLAYAPGTPELRGKPSPPHPQPGMSHLVNRLLQVGGNSVCVWSLEPDLALLLARGEEIHCPSIVLRPGHASQCHFNSAALAQQDSSLRLITGYGLSNDGMWRKHSWCLDQDGRIVETTVARTRYFGVVLTPDETRAFIHQVM